MRQYKLVSILLAITLAVTLTLPSFADTGPAPKNEKQKIEKSVSFEKAVDQSITVVNADACRDVGSTIKQTTYSYDHVGEAPSISFYLDRPYRECPSRFGYLCKRLCEGNTNTIRPPNKSLLS